MGSDFRSELKKKVLAQAAALCVVLGVLALSLVLVVRFAERSTESKATETAEVYQSYVQIGDKKCIERPNVETYLLIGTDKPGELVDVVDKDEEDTIRSDVLLLLVIDKEKDTYAVIPINRNTLLEIRYVTPEGEEIAINTEQAAFAYAVGYSREQSCECTAWSVSRFLYGVHVDHYAAFSLGSIGVLNHAVGGVEVEIADDFSNADPDLRLGETIRLSDKQAETFARGRMDVDDGTNENRMARQAVFMEAWSKQMRALCEEDEQAALELYDDLDGYMYTDVLKSDISRLVKAYLKDESLGAYEIEGTVGEGAFGWATFEADEESKQEAALALLFDPID